MLLTEIMIKIGHVNLFILLSKWELRIKSKWPTGNSTWSSEPADFCIAIML